MKKNRSLMNRQLFLRKSVAGLAALLSIPYFGYGHHPKAASKRFHVADFGAKGDGESDDGPAISKTVMAAVASGPGSVIVFENKCYRLGFNEKASYHIDLLDVSDIHLEGNGALLLNNPRNSILRLCRCSGITMSNFKLDVFPLAFTQGTVYSVNANEGWFDLRIHPDYRNPVDEFEQHGDIMHPQPGHGDWGMFIDPLKRHRKADVVDHIRMKDIQRGNEKDIVRIFIDSSFPLTCKALTLVDPGDRYVLTFKYSNSSSNIQVEESRNCVINDIRVYSTKEGMTFRVSNNDGRITFKKVAILFKPGTNRLVTTVKDGFHCKANRIGPLIEDSYFEGMLDDSVNISTTPVWIKKIESPRVIWVRGEVANSFRSGDKLMAFTPGRAEIIDGISVEKVETMGDALYRLTINREIPNLAINPGKDDFPGGVEKMNFTGLYNLDACGAGYIIRNNVFREQRRHALLVRAPNGLIESNLMDGVGGSAIYMKNEVGSFYEGPFPSNVKIRNNIMKNCMNIPVIIGASHTGKSRFAKNIQLTGNRVESLQDCAVMASNVEGITIADNLFSSVKSHLSAKELACLDNVSIHYSNK